MRTMSRSRACAQLEQRRVRAAKITLLSMFVLLGLLMLWQCAEQAQKQSALSEMAGLISSEASASVTLDPLGLEQEGIELRRASDKGSILWYQSSWDNHQSKVLIQRTLIFAGWQMVSRDDEQVLCFSFAPSATDAGGLLYASFYDVQEGCSVLIEVV